MRDGDAKLIQWDSRTGLEKDVWDALLKCHSVLIHGNSRCGKTTFVEQLVHGVGAELVRFTPLELSIGVVGAAEDALHRYLHLQPAAVASAASASVRVVFLDDLDALQDDVLVWMLADWLDRVRNSALKMMKDTHGVRLLFIGATGRLDLVHSRLLRAGRLDELIEFSYPSYQDRVQILRQLKVSEECVHEISKRTSSCTIADLIQLVNRIAMAEGASEDEKKNVLGVDEMVRLVEMETTQSQVQQASLGNFDIAGYGSQIRKLSDFGGVEDVLESIRTYLFNPLKNRAKYTKMSLSVPKGVLLCGPEGSGKTSLALALAQKAKLDGLVASVMVIDPTQIVSKIVGQSELKLKQAFESCRKFSPCLLIIDQLEQLAARRRLAEGGAANSLDRMLSTLLIEIYGLTTSSSGGSEVVVIGTTRDPILLDPAILRPGRLDQQIHIPYLDKSRRLDILKKIVPIDLAAEHKVNLNHLVEKSEGFTAAQLENLWRTEAMEIIRRKLK
eukprot:TRINITY_DN13590_c0_g2_i1.p1 TRINITY_DN13590_c0_g2~~TRINITY_DN13590_c0_g2_i1.p1  ORF type:complete len:502 (+),score=149.94 TRINITY_DN13590_c0_g2_i1:42-1547(+)